MTGRGDLLALAERVEAAAGADRGLDDTIYQTVTGRCPHRNLRTVSGDADCLMEVCEDCRDEEPDVRVPIYTASLDAAMSLVPEGWELSLNTFANPPAASAYCINAANEIVRPAKQYIATPALAITAAALRARAEQSS